LIVFKFLDQALPKFEAGLTAVAPCQAEAVEHVDRFGIPEQPGKRVRVSRFVSLPHSNASQRGFRTDTPDAHPIRDSRPNVGNLARGSDDRQSIEDSSVNGNLAFEPSECVSLAFDLKAAEFPIQHDCIRASFATQCHLFDVQRPVAIVQLRDALSQGHSNHFVAKHCALIVAGWPRCIAKASETANPSRRGTGLRFCIK
jgi:hypothetical protein